jgi:hypothetical protein
MDPEIPPEVPSAADMIDLARTIGQGLLMHWMERRGGFAPAPPGYLKSREFRTPWPDR